MTDEELNELIKALKEKALGNIITTTIEQYKKNENGDEVLSDRTVKKIANDIDTQACIKLIDIELKRRELEREKDIFGQMTDEELEAEKKRLMEELAFSMQKG